MKVNVIAVAVCALLASACSPQSSDVSAEPDSVGTSQETFTVDVWADNWFALYVDGALVGEDSVPIDVERSFNKETLRFEASYPFTVSIEAKDFRETDSGIEYIGEPNQQMGDGGLIAQFEDSEGNVVAVTNSGWKALVTHNAPLDKSCEKSSAPDTECEFEATENPIDWTTREFDDDSWGPATEYSQADVDPKGGYDEVEWDSSAELIWGNDLETNNTILFRTTVVSNLKIGESLSSDSNTAFSPNDVPAEQSSVSSLSPDEYCEIVTASIEEAGFTNEATVECDGEEARIYSDSYASHEMMTGIVATNEQIPLPAPGYFAPITFTPSFAGAPQTRDSSLAIAVNGVPIFDYTAGGEMTVDDLYSHQPHLDTTVLEQLDECGGHSGRGDDYHYHELPTCMVEQMKNKDDNPIIAWAFDGFPVYGNDNPDGSTIQQGTLDVCNGQQDSVFGYRYHTSITPPYIIQCTVGGSDSLDSVPTIGIERPSGTPVSVDNLTFTHDKSGNGRMSYSYQGNDYYIESTATDNESCFDVEWKTVTNGGVVESGEYCHSIRTAGTQPEGDRRPPRRP